MHSHNSLPGAHIPFCWSSDTTVSLNDINSCPSRGLSKLEKTMTELKIVLYPGLEGGLCRLLGGRSRSIFTLGFSRTRGRRGSNHWQWRSHFLLDRPCCPCQKQGMYPLPLAPTPTPQHCLTRNFWLFLWKEYEKSGSEQSWLLKV